MKQMLVILGMLGMVVFAALPGNVWAQVAKDMAAKSPWAPCEERRGRRSGRWRSPLSGKDSERLMEPFWTASRSIAYSGNH
jgi:hypothetical protein